MAEEFAKIVRSETRRWRPGHRSLPCLFEFAVTKRGLKPKLHSAAGGTESGILRLLGGPPLVVCERSRWREGEGEWWYRFRCDIVSHIRIGRISLKTNSFESLPATEEVQIQLKKGRGGGGERKEVRLRFTYLSWFWSTAEKEAEGHETICLYRGTMRLHHLFNLFPVPYVFKSGSKYRYVEFYLMFSHIYRTEFVLYN